MENKKSYFTKTVLCLMLISVLIGCIALCSMGTRANAATGNPEPDVEPLGLYTNISITLGSSGTTMWAKAKNEFTLGTSTIEVFVELYSSITFQESCSNMTLESRNHISDLNINKTVETTAPINGVQRYWRARVNYKFDKKDWVAKETETFLVDVNGNAIG